MAGFQDGGECQWSYLMTRWKFSSSFVSLHHSFSSFFCAPAYFTANRQGAEIKSEKESSQKKNKGQMCQLFAAKEMQSPQLRHFVRQVAKT